MNFAELKEEVLSVEHEGITYQKTIYKNATTITGVTDEQYPEYSETQKYLHGDNVIVPELKSIYRSTIGTKEEPNVGNFPCIQNSEKWVWFGYVNSANMFALDENIGAKTVGTDVVITMDFNQCNILSFVDCKFHLLTVSQKCNTTQEVTEFVISGKDISFDDFAEYCFKPTKQKRKVILDLEWLPSSTVTLTFTGDMSIGTLGIGREEELGFNIIGNLLTWESQSKFDINQFTGFRTVLRKGSVRVLSAELIVDTNNFNSTAMRVDEIFDRYMLWIPTKKDVFAENIDIGYLENFSMKANDKSIPTQCKIVGVPTK